MEGDRECPNCEQVSMIEKGLTEWVCLNCGSVYDAPFLDAIDEDDNEE